MKKFLTVSLIALSSLFTLPLTRNTLSTFPLHANDAAEEVSRDQKRVNEARDYLKINVDLDHVVSDVYLPDRGLYNSLITWESSSSSVISKDGKVNRPNVGATSIKVTLTASLRLGEATASKTFELTVLPKLDYVEVSDTKFEENFNAYKTGLDISNYFKYDLASGDELATIQEEVKDNNTIGNNKVLDFNPLVTLYKDSVYSTKINANGNYVFETYIMSKGNHVDFHIDLYKGGLQVISIGIANGNFVAKQVVKNEKGENITKETSLNAQALDGVWYKLRLETNTQEKTYHLYLYDYIHNEIKELSDSSVGIAYLSNAATSLDGLRFRTSKGKSELDSHIYLSNILIDEASNVGNRVLDNNPNRNIGIGKIENYTSSFLLIQNEALELPALEIYNRFNPTQKLVKDSDYTISETYKDDQEVDTSKVGDYEKTITIKLKETNETRVLTQVFHVDGENDAADLSTLRIAPIVNDLDATAIKQVSISATIDRKNSKVYYAAVSTGSTPLTAQQVKEASTNVAIPLKGTITIDDASFNESIQGLEANKEYDFYVVTENEQGKLSEVYIKTKISMSVYNIETPEDFYFMCTDPDVQTTSFRLMNDLDFKDYFWEASEITRPTYVGTFDGQGHKISNLEIDAPFKKSSLFYEFGGTFKNLVMENCHLSGGESAGFIGGYAKKDAYVYNVTMKNCVVDQSSSSSGGDGYFGLIFGRAEGGSSLGNVLIEHVNIMDCNVSGCKYVGAMVGNLQKLDKLTIKDCYAGVTMFSDGADLAIISRARAPLDIENCFFDIKVTSAKKEVAVIAGQVDTEVKLKNVLGKLKINYLTQPTYFNTFTGNFSATSKVEFENVYFFSPNTDDLSDEALISDAKSRSIGSIINEDSERNHEWWEKNTWFKNLDTLSHWVYDNDLGRPTLRSEVKESFEFSASEVNHYIDLIEDSINSSTGYYIAKARELYAHVKESEKNQVHLDKLEKAEQKYQDYMEKLKEVTSSSGDIYSSITDGLEWGYEKNKEE